MDCARAAVYLSVCLSLWSAAVCRAHLTPETHPEEPDVLGALSAQLAEALQGFLEGADDRTGLSVEKKASVIPRCDIGERCALKHGPRIGRLCDCLRGAACNTFFLRCY
ncbi:cocaine- and amphetamine-regulated transcript 4 [Lampris incognitus]|uniref:cocaine- and amphetamine-regulated transcript 4 n=1 Tax=Lampris incognitus TaxID=2546036 RepID=UPI0024B5C8B9|nr:cocaine- and amphetamine-regulated transcript 4 [Lampris incognitus]